jgi:hypothetical protein
MVVFDVDMTNHVPPFFRLPRMHVKIVNLEAY